MKGEKRKRIGTLPLFEVSTIVPAVDLDLQAFYNLQINYTFLSTSKTYSFYDDFKISRHENENTHSNERNKPS